MPSSRTPSRGSLAQVVTLEEPLGPSETEALVGVGQDTFRELYDETNEIHHSARSDDPFFIIGRKGAGKTAFLIGAAFADQADVVLIKAEDVYLEVHHLAARYEEQNGALAADNLVHVWEVLLFHAAMLQIARSDLLPNSEDRQRVWAYMSAFGKPTEMAVDDLLAAVGAEMTKQLLGPRRLSFREACWAVSPGRGGSFREAATRARNVLVDAGPRSLYVVVDNLEDLHKKLDQFADVITALFRVASRRAVGGNDLSLPFRTRVAYPAELLPRLSVLAANPVKDFRRRLTIRWTAQELIVVAGNRLRTFLDLYFEAAPLQLRLPKQHDPDDVEAAARTLRAVLPDRLVNDLGSREDPVAYLMRHTQLLPRHLIMILNEIMSKCVVGLKPDDVPKATEAQVVRGVHEAELVIVGGILATYEYEFPKIREALAMIKNRVNLVEDASQLHRIYNNAKVARSGLDFDEFLDGCLAVGALGVVNRKPDDRYVQGEFAYTFADDVRPVEDRDRVCIHPLFVSCLFDRHFIEAMRDNGHRPVYPYGSDPEHDGLEV